MKKNVVMKISGIFLTVVLLFSVSTPQMFALQFPESVSVTAVKQAKTYWCWAACAEMIGKTMRPSTIRTQWDVVRYVKGSCSYPYPDVAGTRPDTVSGAKYVTQSKYDFGYEDAAWDFDYILLNNIRLNKPIIASAGYYKNGVRTSGHSVVIYGTNVKYYSDSLIIYDVYYIDPSSGSIEHCSFDDFCDGSANGRIYDGTIYVK